MLVGHGAAGWARGARVITTAGSPEKVELCRSLGADLTINYRETDFVDAVLEATDGRGVDVAFDSIGGDVTTQTFRCMAFNGRHLLVGFASGIEAEDMGIVPGRCCSATSRCAASATPTSKTRWARGAPWASTGRRGPRARRRTGASWSSCGPVIRTAMGRELGFDEIPEALESMERRETVGRLVVSL